jgi:hypothetical protein
MKSPTPFQQNDDLFILMTVGSRRRSLRDLEPSHAHLLSLRYSAAVEFGHRLGLH